jgi:two-component system, LytTR family, response regulator
LIHIPNQKVLQNPASIIRLEGVDNYTNIYRLGEPVPFLASQTLLYFQKQLPDFLRISKSSLVNPAFVLRVVKKGRATHLRLKDDTMLLVSRRRAADTLEALNRLGQFMS